MSFEHCSADLRLGVARSKSESLLTVPDKGVLEPRPLAELLRFGEIDLLARRLFADRHWFWWGIGEEPASQ